MIGFFSFDFRSFTISLSSLSSKLVLKYAVYFPLLYLILLKICIVSPSNCNPFTVSSATKFIKADDTTVRSFVNVGLSYFLYLLFCVSSITSLISNSALAVRPSSLACSRHKDNNIFCVSVILLVRLLISKYLLLKSILSEGFESSHNSLAFISSVNSLFSVTIFSPFPYYIPLIISLQ